MTTAIGWSDPRTTPGELLWPGRFGPVEVETIKNDLGPRDAAGQLQQRPTPADGETLKRWYWRFWHHPNEPLPPVKVKGPGGGLVERPVIPLPAKFDDALQSWDMSFKDTKAGSFVVGQAWGKAAANRFLLDQFRGRINFPATVAEVRAMTANFPWVVTKLVENKANGPAVVATLQDEIAGMIEVEPEGGKESRANAASKVAESGNVYLPHPEIAPWVLKFIEECAGFPFGSNDDQVDAFSQAQIRFNSKRPTPYATPGGTTQPSTWSNAR